VAGNAGTLFLTSGATKLALLAARVERSWVSNGYFEVIGAQRPRHHVALYKK